MTIDKKKLKIKNITLLSSSMITSLQCSFTLNHYATHHLERVVYRFSAVFTVWNCHVSGLNFSCFQFSIYVNLFNQLWPQQSPSLNDIENQNLASEEIFHDASIIVHLARSLMICNVI